MLSLDGTPFFWIRNSEFGIRNWSDLEGVSFGWSFFTYCKVGEVSECIVVPKDWHITDYIDTLQEEPHSSLQTASSPCKKKLIPLYRPHRHLARRTPSPKTHQPCQGRHTNQLTKHIQNSTLTIRLRIQSTYKMWLSLRPFRFRISNTYADAFSPQTTKAFAVWGF